MWGDRSQKAEVRKANLIPIAVGVARRSDVCRLPIADCLLPVARSLLPQITNHEE
jgi:hypothetical protein